jgi:hypothetical protein
MDATRPPTSSSAMPSVSRSEEEAELLFTLSCQPELDDVPIAHPVGELEVREVGWGYRGRRYDRDDAVPQTGGGCECMRPPA